MDRAVIHLTRMGFTIAHDANPTIPPSRAELHAEVERLRERVRSAEFDRDAAVDAYHDMRAELEAARVTMHVAVAVATRPSFLARVLASFGWR